MKLIHWIVIAALLAGAAMTAPDKEVTKLAILGKVAEMAGQDSGVGILGQASAATVIGMCMTFAPLTKQMTRGRAVPEDKMDRLCNMIQRIQEDTWVVNLGAANFAILKTEHTPSIVCIGAIHNVKCAAFGRGADIFGGNVKSTGSTGTTANRGTASNWAMKEKTARNTPTTGAPRS